MVVIPSNLTDYNFVELYGFPPEGAVGALFVPPNLSNQANPTLITTYMGTAISSSSNQQVLRSTILNITLQDGEGNSLTQLDSSLTICLALLNETKKGKKVCLSYYNERKNKWICEDECLTTVAFKGSNVFNGTKGEHILCGQTDHLTNFALLLTGTDTEDPCQSGRHNTLAWISLGMVGGAVLLVSFSVLVVELHFRWGRIKLDRQLRAACSPLAIA